MCCKYKLFSLILKTKVHLNAQFGLYPALIVTMLFHCPFRKNFSNGKTKISTVEELAAMS